MRVRRPRERAFASAPPEGRPPDAGRSAAWRPGHPSARPALPTSSRALWRGGGAGGDEPAERGRTRDCAAGPPVMAAAGSRAAWLPSRPLVCAAQLACRPAPSRWRSASDGQPAAALRDDALGAGLPPMPRARRGRTPITYPEIAPSGLPDEVGWLLGAQGGLLGSQGCIMLASLLVTYACTLSAMGTIPTPLPFPPPRTRARPPRQPLPLRAPALAASSGSLPCHARSPGHSWLAKGPHPGAGPTAPVLGQACPRRSSNSLRRRPRQPRAAEAS